MRAAATPVGTLTRGPRAPLVVAKLQAPTSTLHSGQVPFRPARRPRSAPTTPPVQVTLQVTPVQFVKTQSPALLLKNYVERTRGRPGSGAGKSDAIQTKKKHAHKEGRHARKRLAKQSDAE